MLDFYDFPDDKSVITKVYQRRSKKVDKQLMIRPCYPTIYKESEVPDASEITEVAVVVDGTWRVGDLVDWSDGGCYWSGRIMKLLDNGKAQVDLLPQPQGEGESYNTCLLKDLRPSLDWSCEHGWTVPNQDGTAGRPCARLIGPPIAQVMQTTNDVQETNVSAVSPAKLYIPSPLSFKSIDEVKTKVSKEGYKKGSSDNLISKEGDSSKTMKNPNSGVILKTKSSTRSPAESIPSPLPMDEVKSALTKEKGKKRSLESTVSMEDDKVESVKIHDCGKGADCDMAQEEPIFDCTDCPRKKYGLSEDSNLRSLQSDTIEAAVMDLEEAINKVKWLKRILLNGMAPEGQKLKCQYAVDKNAGSSKPK